MNRVYLHLQPLSYILSNIDQPGNSFYFYLFSSHLIKNQLDLRFHFYHLFYLRKHSPVPVLYFLYKCLLFIFAFSLVFRLELRQFMMSFHAVDIRI